MKSLPITLAFVALWSLHVSAQNTLERRLFPKIQKKFDQLTREFNTIDEERKQMLQKIGDAIVSNKLAHKKNEIVIICTANSRRSQLGQLLGQTAAAYYGLDSLYFFSGGTTATAFNMRAVNTLKKMGFAISTMEETSNPTYLASFGPQETSVMMYSKKYDDRQNPKEGFIAIMVCSEADKTCPLIPGASVRLALPFNDPKYYDNTPSESLKYMETAELIAKEMLFVFDYAKKQLILSLESKK